MNKFDEFFEEDIREEIKKQKGEKKMNNGFNVNVDGREVRFYRINNDVYGNPRYLVHYLDLGLKEYESLTDFGLKKYRGKDFGGGLVFSSYSLEQEINHQFRKLKEAGKIREELK